MVDVTGNVMDNPIGELSGTGRPTTEMTVAPWDGRVIRASKTKGSCFMVGMGKTLEIVL
jgi:hypothetical protein